MLIYFFAALGFVVILVLTVIAWRMQKQVRLLQLERKKQQQAELEQQNKQRDYLLESIQVIARNAVYEGLNLSEATIRCKVLIDSLLLNEEQRKPYLILETVYQQVSQFATHQARKQLSSAQRKEQDAQREHIELAYQDELMECFRGLAEKRIELG